jgi:hypothetical protein
MALKKSLNAAVAGETALELPVHHVLNNTTANFITDKRLG